MTQPFFDRARVYPVYTPNAGQIASARDDWAAIDIVQTPDLTFHSRNSLHVGPFRDLRAGPWRGA